MRIAPIVLLLGLAVSACGGSSSETPFPLEPDFTRLDGGRAGATPYVVFSGESQSSKAPDAGQPEE